MKSNLRNLFVFLFLFIFLFFSCILKGDALRSDDDEDLDLTGYYELFNPYNVHEIEIQMTQDDFNDMTTDMIQHNIDYPVTWNPSLKNYRVNKYYKANFVYKGPLGDITINDVGFRTKGNFWSRRLPYENGQFQRTHFRIKFNEKFDLPVNSSAYNERDKRKFACMKELNLRWSQNVQGWSKDASQIKEMYVQNLFVEAGIVTARASKAKFYLTIDGVKHDYGLYTLLETIDKQFLTKHYGKDGNDGNLYKCLYPAHLTTDSIDEAWEIGMKDWTIDYVPPYDLNTNTDNPNHSCLINFVNNLNNKTGNDFVNFIDNYFDVDQFLKAIAMNFLIGNSDDYWGNKQNYYFYFHNNRKAIYIPYDMDHCLSGNSWDGDQGKTDPGDPSNYTLGWHNIAIADIYEGFRVKFSSTERPLVDKILAVDKYRLKYEEYLRQFINPENHLFNYDDFESKFFIYRTLYNNYVENDIVTDELMQMESSIKTYFEEKIDSVNSQLP